MAFHTELKDDQKTLTIDSGKYLAASSARAKDLLSALEAMNAIVPLALFQVQYVPGQGWFTYKITAADGRDWDQTLKFETIGVTMTFDVTDRWKLEEFSLQRPIRDLVAFLVRDSDATQIHCNFA